MKRRGYNHRTPLEDMEGAPTGHVDRDGNIEELARRCVECRIKMKGRQDQSARLKNPKKRNGGGQDPSATQRNTADDEHF